MDVQMNDSLAIIHPSWSDMLPMCYSKLEISERSQDK